MTRCCARPFPRIQLMAVYPTQFANFLLISVEAALRTIVNVVGRFKANEAWFFVPFIVLTMRSCRRFRRLFLFTSSRSANLRAVFDLVRGRQKVDHRGSAEVLCFRSAIVVSLFFSVLHAVSLTALFTLDYEK